MAALNTQLLNGFQYLYGQDLFFTKEVMRTCERTLERAQFEEILPPIVVAYSSIVGETDRPVAPAQADIVFGVQSSGGERLALSYENTLPACLFFVENFADSPPWVARRFYYISPHFRNERAAGIDQARRLRQFTQVGFEIIGGESGDTLPVAIGTGSALLSDLGLNHSIGLSEVTLLSRILKRLGLEAAERSTLRDLFDRRDTLAFEAFLARSPLGAKQRALLARLFSSQRATPEELGELRAWLWDNDLEDALASLERIEEVLSSLAPGIRRLASIDLSMVRSARLYTGIIYQYHFEGSEGSECGGGGEYNRVIQSLGGPDTKACGAAFGLERIVHEYKASTANNRVVAQAAMPGAAPGR